MLVLTITRTLTSSQNNYTVYCHRKTKSFVRDKNYLVLIRLLSLRVNLGVLVCSKIKITPTTLIGEYRENYDMDIPRIIGYAIAILITILGIIVLPYGIVLIVAGGLMMWAVYKGGQKKSLKAFQKIEDQMKKDSPEKRDDNEELL